MKSWSQALESYPVADEEVWAEHASRFVAAFVTPAKRERWRWLLIERPRRVGRDSHKVHTDLDRRTCELAIGIPAEVTGGGAGLFYDFSGQLRVFPATSIEDAAGPGDAIFSLVPGRLAVYFFHEGEIWLCQSPRSN